MRVFHVVGNSAGGSYITEFMTESSDRQKFEHGPHLARGPDFGHASVYYRSKALNNNCT